MLLKKDAATTALERLQAEEFYSEQHRLIFRAMEELSERGEPLEILTLTEELRKDDVGLTRVGGINTLTAIFNAVPSAANVVHYIKIVKEKALLRRLIEASGEIASEAVEGTEDISKILDDAESKIFAISEGHDNGNFTPLRTILVDVFATIEERAVHKGEVTGVATGFNDLDHLTAGLQKSDLILVAARPSMGKTAFVLNMAANVALNKHQPVAFFSLEMSKEQLVMRLLSSEGSLDSQRTRVGDLTEEEWGRLIQTANRLSGAPLYIDDTPSISIMELRSKARRIQATHGLSLVVIDYLQLMQGRRNRNSDDSRQQEISEISRSLKALARELSVPVVALSQLSRSVESRQIKRPMLSDLRESGSLEQDADIVMFLYREDYYDPETENKNLTELIIAKHRNGPVDTVNLSFLKQYTKFGDYTARE